ncbi:MAG: Transcriptional regulatory protein LiaR [Anaerolineales bacterium]|nr:Transcriptional regulatory protein LiaR [Anaerolineales bacterium]
MKSQAEKIKVLIVDDHQMVRQGLRTFLELHDDLTVVGEAGDGITAVELCRRRKPNVMLIDLVMPLMDGIETIRQVKTANAGVKVIALTSFTEEDKILPAIQAGASSYLLKDVTPEDLVEVIRAVHRGEVRLNHEITGKLIGQIIRQPDSAGGVPNPATDLTERERDVARLIGQGQNNQAIARALFISDKTVKTHVSNILRKLNLTDRTQLAIYAIKNKLT